MAKESSVKSFKPGEVIYEEGQGSSAFFVIKKGQVEVSKRSKDGEVVPISILNSGEFLGELSVLRGTAHNSTAKALTTVELAVISEKQFQAQLLKTPSWIIAMLNQMGNRLHRSGEIMRAHKVVDKRLQSSVEAFGQLGEVASKVNADEVAEAANEKVESNPANAKIDIEAAKKAA